MKSSKFFLTAGLLASITFTQAGEPVFKNDFEAAAVDQLPAEMMVMSGTFTVKQDKDGKFLELPGEPLDTFGLLFGPSGQAGVTASARFFGTKTGRKFPTFGLSLNGITGHRLQVSPAKKALEIFKGDEVKASVPFEWQPDAWTTLRLEVRKGTDGAYAISGKAWAAGAEEPAKWMIALEEKVEPAAGRAGIWGSPFSGTPIRFDDLSMSPAK